MTHSMGSSGPRLAPEGREQWRACSVCGGVFFPLKYHHVMVRSADGRVEDPSAAPPSTEAAVGDSIGPPTAPEPVPSEEEGRSVMASVLWAMKRMVELRRVGEAARFRVTWMDWKNTRTYRLEIRRASGIIERPIWPLPIGGDSVEELG